MKKMFLWIFFASASFASTLFIGTLFNLVLSVALIVVALLNINRAYKESANKLYIASVALEAFVVGTIGSLVSFLTIVYLLSNKSYHSEFGLFIIYYCSSYVLYVFYVNFIKKKEENNSHPKEQK